MQAIVNAQRRRVLLAVGAGGAAGLAGRLRPALAQGKPLPPYAAWNDPDAVIVHLANTIETERSAFGTSGVTDSDVLFVRNNLAPPAPVGSPDASRIEIDGVTHPRTLTVGELKRIGLESVALVLQCSGNGRIRACSRHRLDEVADAAHVANQRG